MPHLRLQMTGIQSSLMLRFPYLRFLGTSNRQAGRISLCADGKSFASKVAGDDRATLRLGSQAIGSSAAREWSFRKSTGAGSGRFRGCPEIRI